MASVVNRRVALVAEAKARRPRALADRLPPLGWGFALLAGLWVAAALRPLLELGALDQPNWGAHAQRIVPALGDAAVVALPAALLLGFPGVRRRNPWLFRGLVLLALAQLARPVLNAMWSWPFENEDQVRFLGSLFEPTSALSVALGLLGLAAVLLSVGGTWALSDGLSDAGARPRRATLVAVALAGAGFALLSFLPYLWLGNDGLLTRVGAFAVTLAPSLVVTALWWVVAARLLVGSAAGLVPRRAWALGAAAGALLMVDQVLSTFLGLWGGLSALDPVGSFVVWVIFTANAGLWILLAAAFALGLGRGRPFRRHRFAFDGA